VHDESKPEKATAEVTEKCNNKACMQVNNTAALFHGKKPLAQK